MVGKVFWNDDDLTFLYLSSYTLLRVKPCVIITVSQSKGLTVFSKLELHVLRGCLHGGRKILESGTT